MKMKTCPDCGVRLLIRQKRSVKYNELYREGNFQKRRRVRRMSIWKRNNKTRIPKEDNSILTELIALFENQSRNKMELSVSTNIEELRKQLSECVKAALQLSFFLSRKTTDNELHMIFINNISLFLLKAHETKDNSQSDFLSLKSCLEEYSSLIFAVHQTMKKAEETNHHWFKDEHIFLENELSKLKALPVT